MNIQLNTNLVPIFSGTYESIWEVCEYNDNGDELEVDYKHEDLMASIAQVYGKNEAYILSKLNCPFVKNIKFTGKTFSPREYNFKTDELDFEVTIDKTMLAKTLNSLKSDKNFEAFLHDNYTSYDGFMSFTPNNYDELANQVKTQGDEFEQAIGAIITYLAKPNITHQGGCSIESMVHEDWNGNGYYGLDYQIIEPENEVI